MNAIHELSIAEWKGPFPPAMQQEAIAALENGAVLYFPRLAFDMSREETELRSPRIIGKSKNVSYNPANGKIGGTVCVGEEASRLEGMMARFAALTKALVAGLLPRYQAGMLQARTSFRPVEIAGRQSSWRKDDTRLHVDAFPTSPTYGKRILRVFSNVNPERTRVWRVGEPFKNMAGRMFSRVKRPFPGSAAVLNFLRLTKSKRSDYDHYMLKLHDAMKEDTSYQEQVPQIKHEFIPGSTWMCFTDEVSHAAVTGQHQFEQTFLVPVDCMAEPDRAPLRVLEKMAGRALA